VIEIKEVLRLVVDECHTCPRSPSARSSARSRKQGAWPDRNPPAGWTGCPDRDALRTAPATTQARLRRARSSGSRSTTPPIQVGQEQLWTRTGVITHAGRFCGASTAAKPYRRFVGLTQRTARRRARCWRPRASIRPVPDVQRRDRLGTAREPAVLLADMPRPHGPAAPHRSRPPLITDTSSSPSNRGPSRHPGIRGYPTLSDPAQHARDHRV